MTEKRIVLGEGEQEYKDAVSRITAEAEKIEKIRAIKEGLNEILDPMVRSISKQNIVGGSTSAQ